MKGGKTPPDAHHDLLLSTLGRTVRPSLGRATWSTLGRSTRLTTLRSAARPTRPTALRSAARPTRPTTLRSAATAGDGLQSVDACTCEVLDLLQQLDQLFHVRSSDQAFLWLYATSPVSLTANVELMAVVPL